MSWLQRHPILLAKIFESIFLDNVPFYNALDFFILTSAHKSPMAFLYVVRLNIYAI